MQQQHDRPEPFRTWRLVIAVLTALTLVSVAACIQDGAEPGAFSGPSELGLSLALTASPDRLPLDGASQSVIGVHARDEHGNNVANLRLSLQISTSRGFEDFGRLSARSIMTGADGRASAIYTVPAASSNPAGAVDTGAGVTIWVTPASTDASNAISRTVKIRLVPSGTVIPPFDATIGFTFTPDSPQLFDQVRFTTVCAGVNDTDCVRDPSGIIASYTWDFGDGRTGSGPEPTHLYREPGTLVVALTVTDTFGRVARVTRSIVIGGGAVPTAVITVSPEAPVVGETVFFSGISSTAAPGLEIVLWEWDFGDGSFATGAGQEHVYLTEGTYVVILRVTDSADLVGTTSTTVTIASGGPTADFGFSPAAPDTSDNVLFDASGSEPGKGRTITGYSWSFGDGGTSTAGPSTTHTFSATGTFAVRLTVTDNVGDTDILAKEVTVTAPPS